jgi:hypothetical protein
MFTQSLNKFLSSLLLALQALNAGDVLIGVVQVLLTVKAHQVNPDGSPAQVAWRPVDKPKSGVGLVILIFLCFAAPAEAQELPREYLDTRMPATTGVIVMIGSGGNLQHEFDLAHLGDELVISAGSRFVGNFTLPAKSGSGTILIRSSDVTAEGIRVTPADAARMPKLISPGAAPALATSGAASNYRIVGIEFGVASGVAANGGIVTLGAGNETDLSQLPHDLVIDRCYVHGNPTGDVTRGVALNSARTAVIDSYVSNCHGVGFDTQAICGWNGPGPFKIVNDYLEGAAECFMLGGSDPRISGLVPSDVEFRRNTLSKPLSWKVGDPSYAGVHWSIKNLFELKNARRVLIDGNVMEYAWIDGQTGIAVQLTPRNQDGAAPWCTVEDVTFTNNTVRHASAAVNVMGRDNNFPSGQAQRIKLKNNLFDDIGGARWGNGRLFQIIAGPANLIIDHNTAFQSGNVITADVLPPALGFVYTNNLQPHNDYGVIGSNRSYGLDSLNYYFPGCQFAGNALVGGLARLYPPNNFFPATQAAVGYTDQAAGNYALLETSPLHNAATDGKDVGADCAALAAAQSGGDTTPPMLLNLTATGINEYTVMISVQTDEPATVFVEFGYQTISAQTRPSPRGTSHAFTLNFLSPGMALQFRVVSSDSAGNTSASPVTEVRTLPLSRTVVVSRD